MLGNIYTTQRCPVCGGKMVHDERRGGCFCKKHYNLAANKGFYVKFGKGHFKRFKVYFDASRHLNGLRFQKDHGQYDPRDWKRSHPLGFATQAVKWLEFKKKQDIKPTTIKNIKAEINRAISHFGQTNVKAIGTGELEDFIFADHRTQSGQPITSKSRHNLKSTIHQFFVWVCRREKIDMPVFPIVSFELGWRNIVDYETQQQIIQKVRELSENVNIKIYLAIKWLAENPNVRPGEMISIKEGDIFLDKGVVLIRKTKERRKNIKYFILEEDDIEIVRTFPKALPEVLFFRHQKQYSTIKAGQKFGHTLLNEWWKRACRQLGVEGVTLYPGTKHTTVTALGALLSPEEIRRGGTEHAKNEAFSRYLLPDVREKLKVRSAIKKLKKTEVVNLDDMKNKQG